MTGVQTCALPILVGHQLGGGRGRDVTTAAGAVGGAMAGNEMERQSGGAGEYYRVIVAMNNGGSRMVNVAVLNGLMAGDKVRVNGQNIERLGG